VTVKIGIIKYNNMKQILFLTQSHKNTMIAHSQKTVPYEACGLLGGKPGYVTSVYPGRNAQKSPVRYILDPVDQLNAMKTIELRGEEFIGIFHSHPTGKAIPSTTDIAEAYYPKVIHVIIARNNRTKWSMRGYSIVKGKVEEISLQITDL